MKIKSMSLILMLIRWIQSSVIVVFLMLMTMVKMTMIPP